MSDTENSHRHDPTNTPAANAAIGHRVSPSTTNPTSTAPSNSRVDAWSSTAGRTVRIEAGWNAIQMQATAVTPSNPQSRASGSGAVIARPR